MGTENPLLIGPALSLPVQVGCSQLLKESEKPLQGEAPSGQSENLSSNSPGGDSASMGESQHQEASYCYWKFLHSDTVLPSTGVYLCLTRA